MFDTYKEKPAKRPRCLFSTKHPVKFRIHLHHGLYTNAYSLVLVRIENTCRYYFDGNILYSTDVLLYKLTLANSFNLGDDKLCNNGFNAYKLLH